MKKIKAVIFDLDGTLLNTLDDLSDSLNHVLKSRGMAQIPISKVRRFVGNGVPKLIERALLFDLYGNIDAGEPPAELFKTTLDAFTAYYNAHSADKTRLYEGVAEMIDAVKRRGCKTAVVSNKYDKAVQALRTDFFPHIDVAVGTSDSVRPKPAPDGVNKALETLGAGTDGALYVGDGETDIATAKNLCIPVVAVTWGFRDRAELEALRPEYIIDSPAELINIIEKAEGETIKQ